MVVRSKIICISRSYTLNVYEISSFVSALNTLDLSTTSDFYFVALTINDLLGLNVKLLAQFSHHGVRLR